MKPEDFIKEVSKIDQTLEDEFKAKYNSPELIYNFLNENRLFDIYLLTGLCDTLEKAANSLQVQAERNNAQNVLEPKLRRYARKISLIQNQTIDSNFT